MKQKIPNVTDLFCDDYLELRVRFVPAKLGKKNLKETPLRKSHENK